MDYSSVAILLLLIIISIQLMWTIKLLTDLIALVNGQKVKEHKSIPELLGLTVRGLKRRYQQRVTKQKLINQGDVKPVPEVPPDLEKWMARELLKELDTTKPIAKISLSVSTWVKSGRWIGTAEQFAALMDKWEVERIVCRKNRRGDRAFVQPSRPSISALLKAKVK